MYVIKETIKYITKTSKCSLNHALSTLQDSDREEI